MKDKLGHKIIIWKSTDAPVARNLWTVGWQVLHYAAAEKVQHTLVWKQQKKELYAWLWNMYVAEQTNFWGLNYLTSFRWKTFWILENLPMHHTTKIISCQVNTSSRKGIKQLGISFGCILILFAYESSYGSHS